MTDPGAPAARTPTLLAFRSRNFRLFYTGQAVSLIGNWLTVVAQALFVLELTDSGVALGLLSAAQFGPMLVLGAWAGLRVDRADKRRLLLVVQVVAALQSLALAALAFSGSPPVLAVYAIALVGGVATAFENPARRSLAIEMVPPEATRNAVSLNSALTSAARVAGPALAGALLGLVGFGWCFVLDAATYVPVVVALTMVRTRELRPVVPTPAGKGQVREGLRYARRVGDIWAALVMMTLVGMLAYNFQVVYPLLATRDLDGGEWLFTALFATTSAGGVAGALLAARRPAVDVRFVSRAAAGYGLGMAAVALSPNVPVALTMAFLLGAASLVFMTSATSLVHQSADPTMRGRLSALEAIVFLGSAPLGGPVVGAVSEHLGARYGIGLGAVAAVGAGAWGLRQARRRVDAPAPLTSA